MFWHHRICQYAHHPHQNVLPNMPSKKTSLAAEISSDNKQDVTLACDDGEFVAAHDPLLYMQTLITVISVMEKQLRVLRLNRLRQQGNTS